MAPDELDLLRRQMEEQFATDVLAGDPAGILRYLNTMAVMPYLRAGGLARAAEKEAKEVWRPRQEAVERLIERLENLTTAEPRVHLLGDTQLPPIGSITELQSLIRDLQDRVRLISITGPKVIAQAREVARLAASGGSYEEEFLNTLKQERSVYWRTILRLLEKNEISLPEGLV
jgi:hypothetical protein